MYITELFSLILIKDITKEEFTLNQYQYATLNSNQNLLNIANLSFQKEKDPELMFADYSRIPECLITESSISEQCWDIIKAIKRWKN